MPALTMAVIAKHTSAAGACPRAANRKPAVNSTIPIALTEAADSSNRNKSWMVELGKCRCISWSSLSLCFTMPGSDSKSAKPAKSRSTSCAPASSAIALLSSNSTASSRARTSSGSPVLRWTWCASPTIAASGGVTESASVCAVARIPPNTLMSFFLASIVVRSEETPEEPFLESTSKACCAARQGSLINASGAALFTRCAICSGVFMLLSSRPSRSS
mmetsp:Transcript_62441/g.120297  ORF Transcript_62441/g.120297 Transcript_62441/m.120297 type:complete len:218 (-) Transcript_62441:303-956(-)